jgi:tripartite-type tricarboxylate transporter receptor subunit TctC
MRPAIGALSRPERRSELRRDPREDNMTSVRALRGAVASAVLMIFSQAVAADTWPSRPISAISAVSAGNAGDTIARIVLDQVSKQIGQGFVLENRPGGGGTIGSASVAKAEPDGYTVLLLTSSQSSYVVLHKTLPYDPLRDLAPVALFGVQPSVLVAAPSKGWKSLGDLVAAAKAKPGVLNFASAGLGSASHWAAERLRLATGINVQHIPFRGPVEAFTEVMTGRVDFYYLPITPALPNIREGKIVALAVSTPQRAPALPEVQTVGEAGYPDAEYLFWGGLAFPAKPRARSSIGCTPRPARRWRCPRSGSDSRSLACCPRRWAWRNSPRSSTTKSSRR